MYVHVERKTENKCIDAKRSTRSDGQQCKLNAISLLGCTLYHVHCTSFC